MILCILLVTHIDWVVYLNLEVITDSGKFFLIARNRFLILVRDPVRAASIYARTTGDPDSLSIYIWPVGFRPLVAQAEHDLA